MEISTGGRGRVDDPRPRAQMARSNGYGLIEVMLAMGLIVVLSALAIPSALASVDRARAAAAARFLASRMAMARSHAVMRAASVALRFDEDADGVAFQMFADGNRNGVRTRDIASLIDQQLDPSVRLSDLFPGVAIAAAGGAGSDPLRIGSANLLSFSPLGTATSGSVYVRGRDGTQFAIRILGTTGRVRVERYQASTRRWVDAF
ncbi:MAG: GspH/FimT family pseudopilin [Acidobacteria bacterium]|nr:GspH/FimT family pseudopilin [Acidobacteriota bacterium]